MFVISGGSFRSKNGYRSVRNGTGTERKGLERRRNGTERKGGGTERNGTDDSERMWGVGLIPLIMINNVRGDLPFGVLGGVP